MSNYQQNYTTYYNRWNHSRLLETDTAHLGTNVTLAFVTYKYDTENVQVLGINEKSIWTRGPSLPTLRPQMNDTYIFIIYIYIYICTMYNDPCQWAVWFYHKEVLWQQPAQENQEISFCTSFKRKFVCLSDTWISKPMH